MLFFFFKRKLIWAEAITIAVIMPVILIALSYIGGNQSQPINIIDVSGIFLYSIGSYLNTKSEFQRHTWKQNPQNKGHLYTTGLFKYSMHINYFGEGLLFTGWAMIAQNTTILFIPFFMALNFGAFLIPSLNDYLEKKYKNEYHKYAQRTKNFIPFIY